MSTEGKSLSRPGRFRVLLILTVAVVALLIAIASLATRKPTEEYSKVAGTTDSQRIFGGVRQLGSRLGGEDARIQMQVFVDVQSSTYADQFLDTIPPLVNDMVRRGDLQMLLRNRSLTRNATELSFYGVEAAALQNYGWQFAYLMVRNQEAAEKKGTIDREFLRTIAEGIPNIELEQWQADLDEGLEDGSEMTAALEGQDKLAIQLGIRAEPAVVINGPAGTETVQDAPDLVEIQQAINAVR